mmetsp:Transcript_61674/g.201284  ORF Transcript_61674/g.201284 Transcript_61674/m.201284 type:complete len:403 (+) Transcript_61674:54-1262(+)|eukprot:CAMPEP_0203953184 /NCGR_PEP_ID=MMETSP0359-20131031/86617_1 /ASSEMBLY_ACC=CAM_ASM_000338 /TAXON_ID=268821 /ORGANISM="Scrippsiella Hangoei, Strain SHTV-5" /LENGTH=402 /DNA_ID=CAMNT_0050886409 /DNA_START=28 /DNA_END=1236 /DNA_ORIENTATION=+
MAWAVEFPSVEGGLRELLSPYARPEEIYERALNCAHLVPVSPVVPLILGCLAAGDGCPRRGPLMAPPPGGSANVPFTALEALTLIVRILGADVGDLSGDDVDPLAVTSAAPAGSIAEALRSQDAVLTVVDLMNRYLPAFERQQEQHLRLEALRALLLQLSVPPPGAESPWWVEGDIGHGGRGENRRRLVDMTIYMLRHVNDELGFRSKIAALRCLHCLAFLSPDCRAHAMQVGCAELVAAVLRAQTRGPQVTARLVQLPGAETTIVFACRTLVALAPGPRKHARALGELGLEQDAGDLMQRFLQYRQVATAAFALLGSVSYDEEVGARIAASPELLVHAAMVRERWPKDTEEAILPHWQPMAPTIKALIDRVDPKDIARMVATAVGEVRSPSRTPVTPRRSW